MAGLAMYVNSTAPSITITVKRGNYPVDLTSAISVNFQAMISGSTTLAINSPCVIISPPYNGIVRYDWQIGDLNTLGNYLINCLVTYADGTQESTETTSLVVMDTLPSQAT